MSIRRLIQNAVRSGGIKASSVSSIVNGSFDISKKNIVGISTTAATRGLEDIIPKYPKQEAEGEKTAPPKPTGTLKGSLASSILFFGLHWFLVSVWVERSIDSLSCDLISYFVMEK